MLILLLNMLQYSLQVCRSSQRGVYPVFVQECQSVLPRDKTILWSASVAASHEENFEIQLGLYHADVRG